MLKKVVVGGLAVLAAVGTVASAAGVGMSVWHHYHPAPDSQLEVTPNLGLQFIQGGQPAPMHVLDTNDPDSAVQVQLSRSAFELHFPHLDTGSLQVCAWTDASVLPGPGIDPRTEPCLGPATGVADAAFASGTLFLDKQGHNELGGTRVRSADSGNDKVYFSRLFFPGDKQQDLAAYRGSDLYLLVVDPLGHEYVELHF